MNNARAPQPMAVMQRPPSEEEVAFARARAIFAMDVLRLPMPIESNTKMLALQSDAMDVLKAYLGVEVTHGA